MQLNHYEELIQN